MAEVVTKYKNTFIVNWPRICSVYQQYIYTITTTNNDKAILFPREIYNVLNYIR